MNLNCVATILGIDSVPFSLVPRGKTMEHVSKEWSTPELTTFGSVEQLTAELKVGGHNDGIPGQAASGSLSPPPS